MGTVHLLEAVRTLSHKCVVVNVTSDKCYENREWLWGYRETERMGGHDPYSNSKGCAELVTSAFRDSYFPPIPYTNMELRWQVPGPATQSGAETGPPIN